MGPSLSARSARFGRGGRRGPAEGGEHRPGWASLLFASLRGSSRFLLLPLGTALLPVLYLLDNKGQPVEQYEPYFSSVPDFEEDELVLSGVTAILRCDPLGRLTRTDLPDGSYGCIT